MQDAPFFADIADGPDGGQAWWITAQDGLRLRLGLWPKEDAKGTVLLFPGRTEYIEKYGRAARDLAGCGYATLAIDWRGQGLADRMTENVLSGHLDKFIDFQHDVAAMVAAATELDLPRPWHLLAHSMGACIALRSLNDGILPVETAAFSAPMWGIQMSRTVRPVAWLIALSSLWVGLGHKISPGTTSESYVLVEEFEINKLTTDRDMYQYMIDQNNAQAGLRLAGPSLNWLHEALLETHRLAKCPSPDIPCLTVMGTKELIVDIPSVDRRMKRWPGSRLETIEGSKHELLMETPQTRKTVFDMICKHMSGGN